MEPVDPQKKLCLFRTVQASALKLLFEVLKDLLNDVVLNVDKQGVRCLAMEAANTSLCHLRLDAQMFEYFYLAPDLDVLSLGVNCLQTYRLLKVAGASDTVCWSVDRNHSDELEIVVSNSEKNTMTYFRLRLLDLNEPSLVIPEVEMSCAFVMNSTEFSKLVRDMSALANVIRFEADDEKLVLSCQGDYAYQSTVLREAVNGLTFVKRAEQPISLEFSLKYMSLFMKAGALSSTIEIFLKEGFPLIMALQIASLGQIRIVLAPRATT